MIQNIGERSKELSLRYGNISTASIGAIQRSLLTLESQGGEKLFGEPMLNIHDLIQTVEGKGVVNLLDATKLMNTPKLYASLLLWMLSELFETLPESGDKQVRITSYNVCYTKLLRAGITACTKRFALILRTNDDFTAVHPFTDIVVSNTVKADGDTVDQECAQRLSGDTF